MSSIFLFIFDISNVGAKENDYSDPQEIAENERDVKEVSVVNGDCDSNTDKDGGSAHDEHDDDVGDGNGDGDGDGDGKDKGIGRITFVSCATGSEILPPTWDGSDAADLSGQNTVSPSQQQFGNGEWLIKQLSTSTLYPLSVFRVRLSRIRIWTYS